MTLQNHLPESWNFDIAQLDGVATDNKWLLPPLVDLGAMIADDEHSNIQTEARCAHQNGFFARGYHTQHGACFGQPIHGG